MCFGIVACALGLLSGQGCPPPPADDGDGGGGHGNGGGGGGTGLARVDLNVVKLSFQATTQRGPAVGDGVLAFDAENGTTLA